MPEAVLVRDVGQPCALYGETGSLTSVDHIVPVSRGGTDELANLRAVHPWCNARRGEGWIP